MTAIRKSAVAFVAAAALFVASKEAARGPDLIPYKDIGGVLTACYGETKNIKAYDRYTPAQCDGMLANRILHFAVIVDRCLPGDKTSGQAVALISLAYNAGEGAVCGSTLQRKWLANDITGACNQIGRWVYVQGRVIPGLVNRRQEEVSLCLTQH